MRVTFCGHKEVYDRASVETWLNKVIEDLIELGADEFYLGGYGSFDKLVAKTIKGFIEGNKNIISILVLPYIDKKIDTYEMSLYTQTEYPPIENVPKRYAILKRNEYMVKISDVLVAYVMTDTGGSE